MATALTSLSAPREHRASSPASGFLSPSHPLWCHPVLTHTWMRPHAGGASTPISLSGGSFQAPLGCLTSPAPIEAHAARGWILPPLHSWHPPTSLYHHGNHCAPGPDSPRTGIRGSLLTGLPAATLPTHVPNLFSTWQLKAIYKAYSAHNALPPNFPSLLEENASSSPQPIKVPNAGSF